MAVNAFFVVLGSCFSVGLALWLDVSEAAERLKAKRRQRHLPAVIDPDSLPDRRPDSEVRQPSPRKRAPILMRGGHGSSRAGTDKHTAYMTIGGSKPPESKRELPDWLANILLLMVELRSFLLGNLVIFATFLVVIPAGQALDAPEGATTGIAVIMFTAGVFAISWTWVGVLRRPLWIRILLAASVPVVLLGSSILSVAIDSELTDTVNIVVVGIAAGAPVLSVCMRSRLF